MFSTLKNIPSLASVLCVWFDRIENNLLLLCVNMTCFARSKAFADVFVELRIQRNREAVELDLELNIISKLADIIVRQTKYSDFFLLDI